MTTTTMRGMDLCRPLRQWVIKYSKGGIHIQPQAAAKLGQGLLSRDEKFVFIRIRLPFTWSTSHGSWTLFLFRCGNCSKQNPLAVRSLSCQRGNDENTIDVEECALQVSCKVSLLSTPHRSNHVVTKRWRPWPRRDGKLYVMGISMRQMNKWTMGIGADTLDSREKVTMEPC